MKFDVFISYSSQDKPSADATCAALERAGVRCWIAPRDIAPGSDWAASILDALDECRLLVLVFTSSANESPQIRNEVVRAVNRGVPIVPLRIEDIQPTKALAYFMAAVHWLDAMNPPLEKHLDRLTETVKVLLQLEPTEISVDRRDHSASSPPAAPPAKGTTWAGRIAAVVALVLIAGAAAYGFRIYSESHHKAVDTPRERAVAEPQPKTAEQPRVPASAEPEPKAAEQPRERVNVEPQQKTIDEVRDGYYSGPICYGPGRDDPARCFSQGGLLREGKLTGKWRSARDPNLIMSVAGVVSASGTVQMEIYIDNVNGNRVNRATLLGSLKDGRLNMIGAFDSGRRVDLNWRRN